MIVLGGYSSSWCQNKTTILTTGEQDTLCIPIETVKIINVKLTELEYEKEINRNYETIIKNDSCTIAILTDDINTISSECNDKTHRLIVQRNIVGGIGIIGIILAIIF